MNKKCNKCGQSIYRTGEYPCSECGRPTLWDDSEEVEEIAREIHKVYQETAKVLDDVRYPMGYDMLTEKMKEYDRAIARYIIENYEKKKKDSKKKPNMKDWNNPKVRQ